MKPAIVPLSFVGEGNERIIGINTRFSIGVLVRYVPAMVAREIGEPGLGRLAVQRVGARSVVTEARAHSPLRLLTPQGHGLAAWAYMASYGGGLLSHDHIDLHVHVGPGATALLTTQASTKVYRGAKPARQHLHAQIDQGGLLLLLPEPLVCFAGARLSQEQVITLAEGASMVLVDSLHAGRCERGERWLFDAYLSRLRVVGQGRALLHDALRLTGEEGPLPERLGAYNALATVLLVGPAVAATAAALLAAVATTPARAQAPAHVLHRAASPLPPGAAAQGALLRIAGAHPAQVAAAVRAALGGVTALLGDDPFARRW